MGTISSIPIQFKFRMLFKNIKCPSGYGNEKPVAFPSGDAVISVLTTANESIF